MAFAAPLIGAGIGALTGYFTSPDDNKLGGTITGGLLGGLTGGIGNMAKGLWAAKGLASAEGAASTAATTTGRVASGWNPITLAKDAYTGEGGLFNAFVDFAPVVMDASQGRLSPASFTGFLGTGISTKYGKVGFNSKGEQALEEAKSSLNQNLGSLNHQRQMAGAEPLSDSYKKSYLGSIAPITDDLMKQKELTRKNPNFLLGMGINTAGYSALSALDKPSQSTQSQQYSPVTSYIDGMQPQLPMRAE